MKARPEMGNGKWEMGNGRTRMENGKAQMTKRGGFSFIDSLIMVVTVLALLGLFFGFAQKKTPAKAQIVSCVNNLKQIHLSHQIWANDVGKFPGAVSTNAGGTREFLESGEIYRHFMVMSNVLTISRPLVCPEDRQRFPATNWNWPASLRNQNISYFVGVEPPDETKPQTISLGDRNISGGVLTNGNIMVCRSNTVLTWTTAIHHKCGNVSMGDGSVQRVTQLGFQRLTNDEVIRLAIP